MNKPNIHWVHSELVSDTTLKMTTIYSISSSKEKSFRKNNSVLHCIIQGYRPLACTSMHQSYKFAIKISVIDFVLDIDIYLHAYPMIHVHITFHHITW